MNQAKEMRSFMESIEEELSDMGPDTPEDQNPEDVIRMDVPLFIRVLEYAREDSKTDMDLHDLTEKATELSASGDTLSMDVYDQLVPQSEGPETEEPDSDEEISGEY